MAYGKNTCIFRCFFAFLSIPLHCRFLLLIPFYSASFLCFPSAIQKLAKMNTFKCNFFAPKAFPFKFPIWVPSRDSSNSIWTVLSGQLFIQFPFTPRPNNARGLLFCFAGSHQSDSYRKVFCHKIWNTKMAYGKNTCIFLCFYAFLSIPLHSRFLFLIHFYSASFLCFPSAIQKIAKPKAFPFRFPIWVPSRDSSNSKWTVLSGQFLYNFFSLPHRTK